MLPLFKKIFPKLFQSIPEELFLYNIEKRSSKYQLSLSCPKIEQAVQRGELRQLLPSIHLISVPTCGRTRGGRCVPQDTLLLEGGRRRKGVCGHWSASGNRGSRYRYRWVCRASGKLCLHWQSCFWRWTDYSCACQSMGGKYHKLLSEEHAPLDSFAWYSCFPLIWEWSSLTAEFVLSSCPKWHVEYIVHF